MGRVYLDFQNGVPLRACARRAMEEALAEVGNPSSPHAEGRRARRLVERARGQVAALAGAHPEGVIFTGSGTEANATALWGLARPRASQGRRLVVSAVEHLSVLQTAGRMEKEGWSLTVVPVDGHGRVDPDALEGALTPDTALVSVQWVNAEVGTLQPVAEIAGRVKKRGLLFHTDAVAAAGQVPVSLRESGADALSLSSDLLGGPPGVGALVVRRGVRLLPLLVGGAQEEGRRAGTENLIGIVGLGAAAEAAREELPTLAEPLGGLRARLFRGILEAVPGALENGHPTDRLPGHLSVSFPGRDAEALLLSLDLEGFSVGLGSACTAGTMKASHVLKAMGVRDPQALGTIVVSVGPGTREGDVGRFVEALGRILEGKREVLT